MVATKFTQKESSQHTGKKDSKRLPVFHLFVQLLSTDINKKTTSGILSSFPSLPFKCGKPCAAGRLHLTMCFNCLKTLDSGETSVGVYEISLSTRLNSNPY